MLTQSKIMGQIYKYQHNVTSKGFWESAIVKPGSSTDFCVVNGPGVINKLWLTTFPSNESQDIELANNLIINIYWDNSEKAAISVPIADFFCQPLKLQAIENYFFNSTNDQLLFSAEIPMPFRKSARFELMNYSDKHVEFFYGVDVELKELDENALYLHAYWQQFINFTHDKSFLLLPKINGKGRYLGTHISLYQQKVLNNWPWYTRPISISLDAIHEDDKPSFYIKTLDDFFGSAWWDREKIHNTYTYRYIGRSLVELDDANNLSIVMYRYHVQDPLWFKESIEVRIGENWNWQKQKIANGNWSTTSLFYLNSPTSELPIDKFNQKDVRN